MSSEEPAAEQNPYESPAAAGGYFSEELAGIGVWRDGTHVVMHQRSALPGFCIKTGQAVERFAPIYLKWYFPIDWFTRRLKVELPLCEAAYRRLRTKRMLGLVISLTAFVILIGSQLLLVRNIPRGLVTPVMVFGIIAGNVLRSPSLKFVRVHGEYLWFSGADGAFLKHLPDWPYGH